ncbi:MAG: hypothetical protein AAB863_00680 [Patescibacteria group bacterium]
MFIILAFIISLIAPVFLLPIEQVLPYPFVFEELVKMLGVLLIIRQESKGNNNYFLAAVGIGLIFTISESILYIVNILALGDFMIFPKRLMLTGGLHIGTVMLIYFLGRKNYLGLMAGFAGAVAIHYFFNLWVVGL